jgi:hypothetical protein
MDDLTAVRGQATPRDLALVRRLGRRFVPAWGFVAYGVLYLMVVASSVWLGALFALATVFGDRTGSGHPLSPLAGVVVFGGPMLASLLSWWPFVLWIKKRRGEAYRLFGDGQLMDATVASADLIVIRGARVTRAILRFAGRGGAGEAVLSVSGTPPEVAPGAPVAVLFEPSSRYLAAFVAGRAFAASRR